MNKIVLFLIAITAISGVAVLSNNVFTIDLQSYKIFNSFDEFTDPICSCKGIDGVYSPENCQGFSNGFSDPNMLCTAVAGLEEYGSPDKLSSAQGCGVGFWKNHLVSTLAVTESENSVVWPEGYQPEFYFNDMFLTTITLPQNEPDVEISKIAKSENDKNKDDAKGDDEILREESDDESEDGEKIAKSENDKNKDDAKGDDEILREESDDESEDGEKIAKSENDKDEKHDVKDDGDVLRDESEGKIAKSENDKDEKHDAKHKGPTLIDALNAKGGDMNSLLRHSVTAMLNAAHPDINYPYSVIQVIELTQISIINEDYQNTIDMFERFNEELEKPSMCLE